ncbi:16S rRNA (cytosine(1402)-N(4))-methyltransferase RsmH [Athalassotoga saccharophila]|uniref:16S rRNA (cytosine(1402)-N(4))-methyltransferase RsmH n=1 Tax=Athalassotoga saccharophila TaxID=1441386 RepID=UPI0013796435|nr:16S rRNA (cytosine(1402)-N(4))-methyltransferase RsmH [Athalassotoga saccharophila]BBJ28051.1 ribosomal RNA small subunit methyltransferase H [Athalassotoga saccharophila]
MGQHTSVLLKEVVEGFENLKNGGIFVDCTVGGGGHSEGLLEKYEKISLIGMDRDPVALEVAKDRLSKFGQRVRLFQRNFSDLDELLDDLDVEKVDGIFADLGLSSFQIDSEDRGFSFKKSGPLDMQMGLNTKSAYDVVNGYEAEKLEKVIRDYSEERFARRIVSSIIEKRPIKSTNELVEAIFSSLPSYAKKDWKKIVTRVFQAIRIEVNEELENLSKLIEISKKRLKKGGRIGVISFHSLEDRIVKYGLKEGFVIITKKPIVPDYDEIKMNPRSRSAKLRIGERT